MNWRLGIREQWLQARFGMIYSSFALSFTTFATVTYADIPQIRSIFPSLPYYGVVAFIGGFLLSALVGYYHRRYQNPVDIRLANEPLFREIRRIVREELDTHK